MARSVVAVAHPDQSERRALEKAPVGASELLQRLRRPELESGRRGQRDLRRLHRTCGAVERDRGAAVRIDDANLCGKRRAPAQQGHDGDDQQRGERDQERHGSRRVAQVPGADAPPVAAALGPLAPVEPDALGQLLGVIGGPLRASAPRLTVSVMPSAVAAARGEIQAVARRIGAPVDHWHDEGSPVIGQRHRRRRRTAANGGHSEQVRGQSLPAGRLVPVETGSVPGRPHRLVDDEHRGRAARGARSGDPGRHHPQREAPHSGRPPRSRSSRRPRRCAAPAASRPLAPLLQRDARAARLCRADAPAREGQLPEEHARRADRDRCPSAARRLPPRRRPRLRSRSPRTRQGRALRSRCRVGTVGSLNAHAPPSLHPRRCLRGELSARAFCATTEESVDSPPRSSSSALVPPPTLRGRSAVRRRGREYRDWPGASQDAPPGPPAGDDSASTAHLLQHGERSNIRRGNLKRSGALYALEGAPIGKEEHPAETAEAALGSIDFTK